MDKSVQLKFVVSQKVDTHADGTVYIKSMNEGIENTSVVLFRKKGVFLEAELETAKELTKYQVDKLENIKFHPVLLTQLYLISMGASLVFHRDKKDETSDADFHSAYFRYNTLFTTFSNLLSNSTDEFKLAKPLSGEILKGLWYKHVEDASISGMATNILNETGKSGWVKHSLIEKFGPLDGSEDFGEERIKFLVEQFSEGALKRRLNRKAMSGEWLIFEKREGNFHLLTLASHQESNERIRARIQGA